MRSMRNSEMKRILCYGDSNTWGYNPVTQDRFDTHERWTGSLQQALGSNCVVIEEGLNGRTTVWDDPIEGYKNGAAYLIPCLTTHRPLDLVIIMLGTNDLKPPVVIRGRKGAFRQFRRVFLSRRQSGDAASPGTLLSSRAVDDRVRRNLAVQ